MASSIIFLQAANGPMINGPTVRVPFGNYRVEKDGSYESCMMHINGTDPIELNGRIILSNHSNVRITAVEARNLTVRFIRE